MTFSRWTRPLPWQGTGTSNSWMYYLQVKLDREERSNYTLIIDVSDLGSPQQQTSTILTVIVKDEDDHAPQFNRQSKYHLLSGEISPVRKKF